MKKFLLLALLLVPGVFLAQPVDLFQQFNGNYDFLAFGNTLNTGDNSCNILTQSDADFTMPANSTLVAAVLYWAGSGPGDFDVELNGTPVSASRTFGINFSGLDFFAAYADVTNIVAAEGDGTYTLSELDLTAVIPAYCGNQTDFGGWSVIVIHENPLFLLNQISLFDGLEFVSSTNPTLEIILTNIDVTSQDLAKIGFLAWEGDAGLAVNETLLINGNLISNPPLNPADNAFNSTNSYTNASDLWNMDLDFYPISNIVQPGDTEITINLTSGQDFVMVNNIITSVNSELPDATITIDDLGVLCENNSIDVDYTVYNVNSTAALPPNVPIAFYGDGILLGQTSTVDQILIDGSESGTITLNIPGVLPVIFDLLAVVDDDGFGNSTVNETDETNNEFLQVVDLNLLALNLGEDIESCIGYTEILDTGIDDPNWTFQWYRNGNLLAGETNSTLEVTQNGLYRVEAFEGICFVEDEINVNFNAQPVPGVPDDLEVCDEIPNDGFAIFNLTLRDAQIMNGQVDTFVTYFTTEAGANAGGFPIPDPTAFANTEMGFQTVWARLEDTNNPPGCFSVIPLDLIVNDSPAITDPISDYFICDNDGDGVEIFDLTTKDAEILNILVNVTLTYHTSQIDALNGTNPIGTPGAYPSGGEFIWVRAVNPADCVTVGQFALVLGQVPAFVTVPVFEQCDNDGDGIELFDLNSQNATIVDGNLALSVSYHPTQADADMATNPLMIPYASAGEIIFVRVEDNTTGCYGTFQMELIVVEAPEIFEPDPLTYCDDDNDGFGEFILTDADEDVVNGNPSGNLVVSYHETLADAENNVNPLASPYANIDPFLQTVYVRLSDIQTGCYSTTTLLLIVQDSPLIGDPSPLVVCDDDGDGFSQFNLTLAEPEILNGLDPADYTITYFEDVALTIPIVNTTAYPNISNPQTIYVVVEDINNACRNQTTLELIVNLPPQINAPTPLELCDQNNPGDEMEAFNLDSKTFEITGGNTDIIITYHETQGDANTGDNPLSSPYTNTSNPQTIYIRAEGAITGCLLTQGFTLDLVVNPVPSPVTPTPLEVCDVDNDGFALFDLSSKDAEIAGGETVVITYHETLSDAQAGIFALTSPYQNIVADAQTVYARSTYAPINPPPFNTGCYRVVELDLIVLPTPLVPIDLDPLVMCDPEGNGVETFDLTVYEADILALQEPGNYGFTYHETLLDAQAGTPFIGTPAAYQNTSNPQPIWIRLNNSDTGCFKLGQFELQTPAGPAITQPTPLTLCDDVGEPNDGQTLFDLTVKNDEITGGVLGVGVRYYESLTDAQNDENAIDPDTAYQNTSNPQTLYVRVTDGNTECFDTTLTLTLRVSSNPEPGTPDALRLCDINDPGDGVEVFDLTLAAAQILDGEPWDLTYHESYDDAFDDLNEIVDPQNYPNQSNPQTIYVRVENNTTPEGCFEIVELELIVDPLPDASAVITPYILCEVGNDGEGVFDLTTKIPEILGANQSGDDYAVSFYESQAEADGQLNPIQNATSYVNMSNPQTIYVGIENNETLCYVSTQTFELEVREGATATSPDPYIICDNVGPNDGIGEFVLDGSTDESQLLIDQILSGQDPGTYLLSFHATLEDAQNNQNPLSSPYTNTINPQIIYARVENDGTECDAITEVLLKVEELPEVALEEFYRLCVDANGNPIPEDEGALSPPIIDTGLDPEIYAFEWYIDGQIQLGQDDPSIVALQGGIYTVIVTELQSGCTTEASTTVTVSSPPLEYDVQAGSDAFADSHIITATAEGLGEYIFQLDDGPFQDEGVFEGVFPGVHTVTIKDANGCGSVTVEVSLIDYPRFVTPNQDGYHDTWNIIGIAGGDPTAKIYIFDKFGKLLKQLSPLGEGWDGTYNGNPLPSSDYWFLVEYTEDDTRKEFRGHFTLKR